MVSVVMATYNGEKYIEQQLDSIRCQTQKPDEVIICDDKSVDKTVKIIEEYIVKYKLIGWKIIKNNDNIGYFDNFFKAISMAKGDTIYLSDQDDIWDLRKIQTFEGLYSKKLSVTMVQSNMRFIDKSGNFLAMSNHYHGKMVESGVIQLSLEDMCKFAGSGYTMSFRKIVRDRIFDSKLNINKDIYVYHDILLGLMAVALGECYLCADIKDNHRLHDTNATQTKSKNYIVNRTKEKQLNILNRRIEEFGLILDVVENKVCAQCFEKYMKFAQYRKNLIADKQFGQIINLIKNRHCYSTKFGLITDILYMLNLEKLLLFIYRKI